MKKESAYPEILYHYTTQQGLLGILHSKAMWLSNLHYLNDTSEFIYSINLAKKYIEERIKLLERTGLLSPPPALGSSPNHHNLYGHLDILDDFNAIPIYICSFSREGDQLGQWRGYCNNGSGFSIGFDYKKLRILAENQS